jgi:hypothetical protein
MTSDEYQELCDSNGGVCLACGEYKWDSCEPDAENYECDECGRERVMGAEQALICGFIEFVEKDEGLFSEIFSDLW